MHQLVDSIQKQKAPGGNRQATEPSSGEDRKQKVESPLDVVLAYKPRRDVYKEVLDALILAIGLPSAVSLVSLLIELTQND